MPEPATLDKEYLLPEKVHPRENSGRMGKDGERLGYRVRFRV